MSDKGLNDVGLARVLERLKANFATKAELQQAGGGGGSVSYLSDSDVIDILNDTAGTWNGSEKMKTLWTNASPTSSFAAQNVTLSESYEDYDLIIIEFKPWQSGSTGIRVQQISLPGTNGQLQFVNGSDNNRVGRRVYTLQNLNEIAFEKGEYNAATNNGDCVPTRIFGIIL